MVARGIEPGGSFDPCGVSAERQVFFTKEGITCANDQPGACIGADGGAEANAG